MDLGCLVPCVTYSPGLDLKVGMDVGRLFGVCRACAGCWLSPQPGEIHDPLCGGAEAQVHRPVWASAPWQQNSPLDTGFPDYRLTSKYSKWGRLPETASPGGKGSGIFDESGPVQTRPRLNPPGGKTSDIFGSPVAAASPTAHPNKPKDHVLLCEGEDTPDLRASASPRQEPGEPGGPKEAARVQEPAPAVDSHEPRLGPRPRSHNKVLNPPGGKSSISFY